MIVDAPAWVDERRFDIEARTEVPPALAQYPGMLQRLLADRFKLKTHVERRPVEVYSLVVAREDATLGPRLQPASEQSLELDYSVLRATKPTRTRPAWRCLPPCRSSSDSGRNAAASRWTCW